MIERTNSASKKPLKTNSKIKQTARKQSKTERIVSPDPITNEHVPNPILDVQSDKQLGGWWERRCFRRLQMVYAS